MMIETVYIEAAVRTVEAFNARKANHLAADLTTDENMLYYKAVEVLLKYLKTVRILEAV